jgi:hypothetical protein
MEKITSQPNQALPDRYCKTKTIVEERIVERSTCFGRSSIFMTNVAHAPNVDAKTTDILAKNKIDILLNSAHISKLYKRVVIMNIMSLLVLVLVLSLSMFNVVPIKILFS